MSIDIDRSGTPILSAEIRHLGGAIARARPEHGAVASFAASYSLFAVGMAPTLAAGAAVEASVQALMAALEPWAADHTYLNFADSDRAATTLWTETAHHRLRRIKAAYDPENVIRSNHPIR